MTKLATYNANLQDTGWLKRMGFLSKTHSLIRCLNCGVNHKAEIDSLILNERMSDSSIINTMIAKYPECKGCFPSDRALATYRLKYLNNSVNPDTGKYVVEEVQNKIISRFHPMLDGVRTYLFLEARIKKWLAVEAKLGQNAMPMSQVNELVKLKMEAWDRLVDLAKTMGALPQDAPSFIGQMIKVETLNNQNVQNNAVITNGHPTPHGGALSEEVIRAATEAGMFN